MTEMLRVRNWDKYQSYRKDRGQPPWIKVHRSLMRNAKWVGLTDVQKAHLVCIWLLAADENAHVLNNPALVQKLCFLDEQPDLEHFVSLGFLEKCTPDDANTTTERRQHVQPEKRREETDKAASPPCVHAEHFGEFWDLYPRKQNRARAEKSFKRLKPSPELFAEILEALERQKASEQWQRDGGAYVPHASTWLNGRRWEDEITGTTRDRFEGVI